jgi:hypothetical protein
MNDKTAAADEGPSSDSTSSDIQPQFRTVTGGEGPATESVTSTGDETTPLAYGQGKAVRKIIRGRIINGTDTDDPE